MTKSEITAGVEVLLQELEPFLEELIEYVEVFEPINGEDRLAKRAIRGVGSNLRVVRAHLLRAAQLANSLPEFFDEDTAIRDDEAEDQGRGVAKAPKAKREA